MTEFITDNVNADDIFYMHLALHQAQIAYAHDEVPVGAIVVANNRVIGRGFNQPITQNDPSAHAEICALRHAAKEISNYRLVETTLYVTVEPCTMCLGALMHARVARVVFGVREPKAGRLLSHPLINDACFNHRLQVVEGLCEIPCKTLMQRFFAERRARKKAIRDLAVTPKTE